MTWRDDYIPSSSDYPRSDAGGQDDAFFDPWADAAYARTEDSE